MNSLVAEMIDRPYALFAHSDNSEWPRGGWHDWAGCFESVEDALTEAFSDVVPLTLRFGHVVNLLTREQVASCFVSGGDR